MAKVSNNLPLRKGTGRDGLPAEVLQAGGEPIAERLTMLIHFMVETEQVPSERRGGRMVTAWKGKGAMEECDSHRGLLLSDHACKAFTSLLKDKLESQYANHIPDAQSGCVRGRSPAFVCHTSRSFIDYCRMAGLSAFLLFLDLAKAFD